MSADELDTLNTLRRNAQSLRDREKNATQQLVTVTERYRQLESELCVEKAKRLQAENALADGAGELDSARRSAKFSVDQCKREVENRRRLPTAAVNLRLDLGRQHPRQVVRNPTTGDVTHGMHLDPLDQRQASIRIDPGRLQQFGTQRPAELGNLGFQRPTRIVEQHLANQGITVGM